MARCVRTLHGNVVCTARDAQGRQVSLKLTHFTYAAMGCIAWFVAGCVLPDLTTREAADAGDSSPRPPSNDSGTSQPMNGRAGTSAADETSAHNQDAAAAMHPDTAIDPSGSGATPPNAAGGAGGATGSNKPGMNDDADAGASVPDPKKCAEKTCQPGGTCVNDDLGYYCRCRAGFSATGTTVCVNQRYSTTSDTVKDLKTGLLWQRTDAGIMTASLHSAYCKDLTLVGGGWRLPTIEELEGLVDLEVTGDRMLMIDWVSFNMHKGNNQSYSSSSITTMQGAAGQIWGVDFSTGKRTWYADAYLYARARCVR
jgi:hypothetical protein